MSKVDLTNCDQEPIHIPGAIQPHGVLLALRPGDFTVVHASESCGRWIGVEAKRAVGAALDSLIEGRVVDFLRRAIADGTLTSQPLYLTTLRAIASASTLFDGIAHRFGELVILELEPSEGAADAYSPQRLYHSIHSTMQQVENARSLQEMCEVAAAKVRLVSGFDRVMIYRFDPEWNGAVVAEAKAEALEPFLGLNYPASDIPTQARELYRKNRLRFIADRDYTPSPIIPGIDAATGRPLDMSHCVLRSVSPIHLEYLRNMGVRASMSISLMRQGELWGLIACHHYAGPRHVSFDARTACELVGHVMSLQLAAKEELEVDLYTADMAATRARLAAFIESGDDPAVELTRRTPNVLDFIHADGAAVVQGDRVVSIGKTPNDDDVREIARWLSTHREGEIFATDSLASHHPPFERLKDVASGLLSVSLTKMRAHYIFWFRPEKARTVDWAGDPTKSVVKGDDGVRLSPRGSFALWKQTVRLKSQPWTRAERTAALELRREVAGNLLRRAERLATLHQELISSYTQLDSVTSLLTQSEERLREATEAGGVGIIDWDLTTGRVALSGAHHRLAGLEPSAFDETMRAYEAMIHPDDRARVRRTIDSARNGDKVFEEQYRLLSPQGGTIWVAGRGRFLRDASGRPVRMTGVVVDITRLKTAEEEKTQLLASERTARSEAERASRLKDEFLATLSHELRTPLNAIVGWAAMLRGAQLGDVELTEGLEAIERNAQVQTQLVEDLLDVSRIIAGKLRLDVQHVEIAPVVEAAVASVQPAATNKGVRLQKVLDPRAAAVWGDPGRLQQVVWNLLSNAIKFTPRGGRVQVSVARINSHVELTVSDSGIGIKPEFLPHVFDRFRQADATTTRKFGGLGIGLALVRHLVELHGGSVQVQSEGEGKGATFIVRLPLKVVARNAEEAPADRRVTRLSNRFGDCPTPSLTGVRALVVDDEPDTRILVKRILEECETKVTTAGSVAEALTLLSQERFDVIVSDIGMPDQDGYELIRQVRSMPTDAGGRTPAVALTAMARTEDRRRALLAGFQIHVPKPVDPSELLAVVASVAGRTGT